MSNETNRLTDAGVGGRLNWLFGGALGGFVGAAIFGAVLWLIDPTVVREAIPQLYGFEADGLTGWVFHLANGVVLGVIFGFVITRDPILGALTAHVETPALDALGPNGRMMLAGIVYGIAIWAMIPGIILSALVTVWGVESPFPWGSALSLVGHILYGTLLGGLVSVFVDLESDVREADAPFEEPTNPPSEQES
jgi:hypothetical protein